MGFEQPIKSIQRDREGGTALWITFLRQTVTEFERFELHLCRQGWKGLAFGHF